MKMTNLIFTLAVLWISSTSCTRELFKIESENTAPGNFHHIWKDFSENYGLFAVKHVDWDSVLQVHEAQIDPQTTDAQLYVEVTEMLRTLNDRHITLNPASNPELPTWGVDLTPGGTYIQEDFNLEVVKNNYLAQYQEPTPVLQYGVLDGHIGYIHILHFDGSRKAYEKGMDAALRDLAEMEGMIIDIRDNGGGFDPNAQYVAGRFATQNALYMTTRKKKGPGPNNFAETREWIVAPTGSKQFTRPCIVLTSTSTASAAETFLLALLTQPHIQQMGTTTAGSFSDNPVWEAPNGWTYTISVGDFRAADGRSYEGIGLVPQIVLDSRREDWVNGRDVVLEKALELLP